MQIREVSQPPVTSRPHLHSDFMPPCLSQPLLVTYADSQAENSHEPQPPSPAALLSLQHAYQPSYPLATILNSPSSPMPLQLAPYRTPRLSSVHAMALATSGPIISSLHASHPYLCASRTLQLGHHGRSCHSNAALHVDNNLSPCCHT